VRARVSYSRGARRATLNPRRRLRAGTTYRVDFTTDVVDAGANRLRKSERRWTFTTGRR
jgi:hypothetical protein